MKYSFLVLILLLLHCLFLSGYAIDRNVDTDLHSKIECLMKEHKGVGLYVVVVKNKKIVYYNSYGYNPNYSDSTKRKPIKKDDIHYMASISKTFIGTATMQLVEQGKLGLDDDVSDYLDFSVKNPYYPDVPITIRMLLAHNSSLKNLKGAVSFDKLDILNPNENEDFQKCYNNCRPGTEKEYSNFGYVVLGAVLEKASGVCLDEYIQKNIIVPLGLYGGFDLTKLDSTRFVKSYRYRKNRFIKQPAAYSPDKNLKNYVLGYSTTALHPADGMIISGCDLARYMIMHMNKGVGANGKRIISEDSEMLLRDKSIHNLYYTTKYVPGVQLIGMNGGARGMHTEMFFSPDKGFGFVILCNGCNSTGAADGGLNKLVMQELYKTFIAE